MSLGTFPLKLHVRFYGDSTYFTNVVTWDFAVTLVNKCLDVTFTIDSDIFSSWPEINYNLGDSELVEVMDDSLITLSESPNGCPDFEYTFIAASGGSIDSDVFTFDELKTLLIQSSDSSTADEYSMKLKVKFEGAQYTNYGELEFKVVVVDDNIQDDTDLDTENESTESPLIVPEAKEDDTEDISVGGSAELLVGQDWTFNVASVFEVQDEEVVYTYTVELQDDCSAFASFDQIN